MKYLALTIISTLLFHTVSYAQLRDTSLANKLTLNGFCLCQTKISDLKQPKFNLKEVDVEEMDLAKGCYGQDSRFIAGKGYYSDAQPGMIFQKEQGTNYISKIRLTSKFKGKLPDGNFVDLSKFLLKDLFKLYPQFKQNWQSRDCSDYWRFSNDTISFYVKINKSKKPQFPIDEEYYLDKPIDGVDLIISCEGVRAYDAGYHYSELHSDPIFFIDNVKTSKSDFKKMDIKSIALLTVIKDTVTLKKFGAEGINGLIYIETKKFTKERYWKYFSSRSSDYAKIVTSPTNDSSVQYVLNNKVLKEDFEGELASVNDITFKTIQVISKQQLIKGFGVSDKDYGIIITTK